MIVRFNTSNEQFFARNLLESLVALRPAYLSIRKYVESSIAVQAKISGVWETWLDM